MKKIFACLITMMLLVGAAFAEDVVIFEPGVTPVKGGKVVEVDGTKYFQIKCYGYDTSFKVPGVDLSKCTEFEATVYVDKPNEGFQAVISIKDKGYGDIANPTVVGLKVEAQVGKAEHEIQQSWNKLSKTDLCELIQPMVQDTKQFQPKNYTLYIGKIVAR
jgi:hypothetical protein